MKKKDRIRLIVVFLLTEIIALLIYFVAAFSMSTSEYAALNGIVWLLLFLTSITGVNLYLQLKTFQDNHSRKEELAIEESLESLTNNKEKTSE